MLSVKISNTFKDFDRSFLSFRSEKKRDSDHGFIPFRSEHKYELSLVKT